MFLGLQFPRIRRACLTISDPGSRFLHVFFAHFRTALFVEGHLRRPGEAAATAYLLTIVKWQFLGVAKQLRGWMQYQCWCLTNQKPSDAKKLS